MDAGAEAHHCPTNNPTTLVNLSLLVCALTQSELALEHINEYPEEPEVQKVR